MRRRTGMFWDAVARRRPMPRAAANLDRALVAADPERGTLQAALAHAFIPLLTVPRAACDHGAPASWQVQSMHRTSAGTVAYARCPCGAWLVLLDGQPLAAAHPDPRPHETTPSVPGERPRGRGRWWLWDRGQAWWRRRGQWPWRWRRRQRQRADPDPR